MFAVAAPALVKKPVAAAESSSSEDSSDSEDEVKAKTPAKVFFRLKHRIVLTYWFDLHIMFYFNISESCGSVPCGAVPGGSSQKEGHQLQQ